MGFHIYKAFSLSLVLLLLNNQATASTSVHGKSFQDWGGNCQALAEGGEHCYLEQVLYDGEQKVMISVIGYVPNQTIPSMAFELPPNIHLAAGFSLTMDGKVLVRFKGKCAQARCTASFNLTPQILQQFQKGRAAEVSYLSTPKQKPVVFPLSLMGITAGLRALQP